MRICKHRRQAGGREISQVPYIGSVSFTKHLNNSKETSVAFQLLSKTNFPLQLNIKFVKLHKGLICPINRPNCGMTFSETVYWLVKCMIMLIASKKTNAVVSNAGGMPFGTSPLR